MPLLHPKSCSSSPSHSEWKLKLRVASRPQVIRPSLLLWLCLLPPLSSDSLSSYFPLAFRPGLELGIFSSQPSIQLFHHLLVVFASFSLVEVSPFLFHSTTFPPSISAPWFPHLAILFLFYSPSCFISLVIV